MSHREVVRGEQCRELVASWPHPIRETRKLLRVIGRAAMVQASEVALLASFVTTMPPHLTGAPYVQAPPALPSRGGTETVPRPVLLVHGFCGTKSSWSLVAQRLVADGFTVEAISYSPFGTSVERLADRVVAEVGRILAQTGADKVHLVGHSLGGVVIAEAFSDGRLDGLVDTVVTLGAPFGGSPWATLMPVGEVARALRCGSALLSRLNSSPVPNGVRWFAFTAEHDIVVPGLRSVPNHALVDVVTLGGVGHLGMLLSRNVVDRIAGTLRSCPIAYAQSA